MSERTVLQTKTEDGKDMVLLISKPTAKQLAEAKIVAANKFQECLKKGVFLRATVAEELVKSGLWTDEKEKELEELGAKLNEGSRKLLAGGAGGFKKSQARQLAIDMRDWRAKQTELFLTRRQLDEWTCESQAENAEFDYLVSVCTSLEDTRPAFDSLDDYREKSTLQYAYDAAEKLAEMRNNIDLKWVDELPENKFLKSNGFINDKGRLVRADGKIVDSDGRLVNNDGRFIDENNNFIDKDGKPVDKDGNPLVEFTPWAEE